MCKKNDSVVPDEDAPPAPNPSSTLMMLGMLGLMLASAGSVGLQLYRIEKPDFLIESVPEVSFIQCMTFSGVCIGLMGLYIVHLLQQVKLISLGMPLVPSPVPLLGHAFNFLLYSPWDLLLGFHKKYGDIFCFSLMGRSMVSLSTPNELKMALQSRIKAVKKDVGFTYQPFLVILGKGIVTSEDKDWMKQRLKMSTALRINVLEVIPKITLEAVQTLMKKLDKAADDGSIVELSESLRHLTLQVISKAFLSLTAEESDSTFAKFYLPIVDECNTRVWHPYRPFLFFLPFWWKHQYMIYKLNSYVSSLIVKRWKERMTDQPRKDDILDLVLDSYQKDHPDAKSMPDSAVRQIRDEFKTFMLAGHETSAAMMTWAFYELIGDTPLYEKVVKEGQDVFGAASIDWMKRTDSDLPARERLGDLTLSEACLKVSCIRLLQRVFKIIVPGISSHCHTGIPPQIFGCSIGHSSCRRSIGSWQRA